MRPARSKRSLFRNRLAAVCALLSLGLTSACGATGAAPTPTVPQPTAAAAAPVASPQRPPLASPVASPAAAPTPSASTAAESEQTYTVQSGDTLLSIAEQFYGDGTKWRRIYDANKDVIGSDPDKLKLDMKLKIPPKES
jgi:nucleoid-associated protein YgaU